MESLGSPPHTYTVKPGMTGLLQGVCLIVTSGKFPYTDSNSTITIPQQCITIHCNIVTPPVTWPGCGLSHLGVLLALREGGELQLHVLHAASSTRRSLRSHPRHAALYRPPRAAPSPPHTRRRARRPDTAARRYDVTHSRSLFTFPVLQNASKHFFIDSYRVQRHPGRTCLLLQCCYVIGGAHGLQIPSRLAGLVYDKECWDL